MSGNFFFFLTFFMAQCDWQERSDDGILYVGYFENMKEQLFTTQNRERLVSQKVLRVQVEKNEEYRSGDWLYTVRR